MRTPFQIVLAIAPFLEILLLAKLITILGFWATFGLVLISASLGLSILKSRGLQASLRLQQGLLRGVLPGEALMGDALSSLGALLLIVPGPITDLAGLLLQVPALQILIGKKLFEGLSSGHREEPRSGPRILEGEFHREDPRPEDRPPSH